ncbi:hypothetical protein U9M48_007761 [Paspalum notatum var. saurae]|uniref:F-box domain-containing protein n=1 Tax=Paspalum notatum var. saurae TaxID=547442 RepID=A0AAQ3SMT2_PASNO
MEKALDSKKQCSTAATGTTAAGGGSGLPDDLIVDILSRTPVKSICRFKCVSPAWRDLISHPDNRKKLPQTLTGFLYFDEFDSCQFISVVQPPRSNGRLQPPSPFDFAFLPSKTRGGAVDCCNGLVLLNSLTSRSGSEPRASYIVCNPATEKWTTVPESSTEDEKIRTAILCFDPAVSEHFHVVRLLDTEPDEEDWFSEQSLFEGFEIYSSETGSWAFHPRSNEWSPFAHRSRRTYSNSLLHFITGHSTVASLDMKGRTCRVISVPRSQDIHVQLIGHSQGCLFYVKRDDRNTYKISIYLLEEHGGWTLKHCVNTSGLFGNTRDYFQSGSLVGVAAIHPHCNSVFLFHSLQGRMMIYNMDNQSGRVVRHVTAECLWSFVPYVPRYLETPALKNSN